MFKKKNQKIALHQVQSNSFLKKLFLACLYNEPEMEFNIYSIKTNKLSINSQDPKYQKKAKSISSPEQIFFITTCLEIPCRAGTVIIFNK